MKYTPITIALLSFAFVAPFAQAGSCETVVPTEDRNYISLITGVGTVMNEIDQVTIFTAYQEAGGRVDYGLIDMANTKEEKETSTGSLTQETPSNLPDWNFTFRVGGSYSEVDVAVSAAGSHYQSTVTDQFLSMGMSKDNLFLGTTLKHQHSEGKDRYRNVETDYSSIALRAGYQLLQQDTQAIDLTVHGMLELGYRDVQVIDDQLRLSPGIGINIGRSTPLGYFSTGYLFLNSRNVDGDVELSDASYINTHSTYLTHTLPIYKQIVVHTTLNYIWAEDIHPSVQNDWLILESTLTAKLADKVYFSGGYNHDLNEGDTHGFTLSLQFLW